MPPGLGFALNRASPNRGHSPGIFLLTYRQGRALPHIRRQSRERSAKTPHIRRQSRERVCQNAPRPHETKTPNPDI